jgi:hypothetical protein
LTDTAASASAVLLQQYSMSTMLISERCSRYIYICYICHWHTVKGQQVDSCNDSKQPHKDPVLLTLYSVFPSLCVPSVSAGNLATSPVPGTVSHKAPVIHHSLQVILLGLMGLLDSQLWSGRLLSYSEVALLGFHCLGWRWGTQC